jgi:hypothetical protein
MQDTTAAQTIARTILEQLGGGAFAVMTGAKNFTATGDGLALKVGRNEKGVTHVRVTLDASDTYTMTFLAIRAGKSRTVASAAGLYCDMIRGEFERSTGLRTSLTAVYA